MLPQASGAEPKAARSARPEATRCATRPLRAPVRHSEPMQDWPVAAADPRSEQAPSGRTKNGLKMIEGGCGRSKTVFLFEL